MKSIIVAYDKNRVIGNSNGLPWMGKLPADMRHFKELTTGKTVIMGRKTYESIGRALPNRQNIVVSRGDFEAPGITVVHGLPDAYALATGEVMIIGGGQIYLETLDDVDTIYATEIATEAVGDVYFPQLPADWVETYRENHAADEKNAYDYAFVTFTKQQSVL